MATGGSTAGVATTVIGRSARVRGRIAGDGHVEVQGFVEGDIAVTGDVTIEAEGMVGAGITGHRLVVRGAVKGDLTGEVAIAIESGARVVGDIRAPRVTIAEGALVRGFVQTSDNETRTETTRTASRAVPARATGVASRLAPPPRASLPRTESAPIAAAPAAPPAPAAAAKRSPPPPVVPALKKLRGQVVRKKER